MVSVQARRDAVAFATTRGVSQRRACTLLDVARSALGYCSRLAVKDAPALKRMAARQQSSSFEAILGANMFGNVLLVVATLELMWITKRIPEAFDVGRKLLGYREP